MGYLDEAGVYGVDYLLKDRKVWANEAPEYDATATYKVGDRCLYDGVLMRCTTAIPVPEAWTAAHWTAVTFAGELDRVFDPLQIAKMMSAMLDGTDASYRRAMKAFFDTFDADSMTPAELTDLVSIWYEGTRDTWNGYTRFYKDSVSTVSTGTKGGDNAGMVCEPSTDAVAGRDDYAGLPLFAPTDVNYTIDADTLEPVITGIKGITSGFEKDNPDKLVGVIQMSGYLYSDTDTDTFDVGYSAQPLTGHGSCQPVPEAVKIDGTVRQFVIHTKYMGKVVNNKMRAYSGVIPTAWQSHNTLQTNCKANGAQYGGGSVLLQSWLILMTRIKYGSLTQDGSVQGCLNYNYQYYASVAETGVKRLLITPAQAATLIVGSGVLVGTVGANANVDRNTASVYSISGQKGAIITAIESVEIEGTTYGAVYVDTDDVFNTVGDGTKTTGNTMISTFYWPTGTNDNILGNDGSKASPGTGVYPAKLQGIEYSVGAWEVFGDVIIRMLPADNDHEFGMIKFALVDRAANQTTSVSGNYRDSGVELTKPSSAAGWSYIKHQSAPKGVFLPDDCSSGGSSSVLMRDGVYFSGVVTSEALREFLAFGSLYDGVAYGGLSDKQKRLNSTLEGAPTQTLTIPYVEVGVGIGNILRIADVMSVWRLTNVGDGVTPRWAIRFRLNLGL